MTETQENVTFTIPTNDAKHMVTILTKLETASTLKHVNAQFVTNNTGAVTLCTEAYATSHGFGITQLTQHYPNSTGDMANIVTFVLAASDLKSRLRERTQTADKGESISITLEVAPNTTVNSVCESPVKPPVEYEYTFTIGQKELNTLQARHTYTRFKDTGFEMMNIVYTPGSTMGYGEVAERSGAPRAVRAVANACASNRLAVAVPCHRVVRQDGHLSGYRWGVARKRELLRREGWSEPASQYDEPNNLK